MHEWRLDAAAAALLPALRPWRKEHGRAWSARSCIQVSKKAAIDKRVGLTAEINSQGVAQLRASSPMHRTRSDGLRGSERTALRMRYSRAQRVARSMPQAGFRLSEGGRYLHGQASTRASRASWVNFSCIRFGRASMYLTTTRTIWITVTWSGIATHQGFPTSPLAAAIPSTRPAQRPLLKSSLTSLRRSCKTAGRCWRFWRRHSEPSLLP
jgi:hypothetical protein